MLKVCNLCNFLLSRIVIIISFADYAKSVAESKIFNAHIHKMFADSNTCRTCAVNNHLNFSYFLFNKF